MAIFGRRPGSSDIGYGEMLPGQARGAIMGRPSANGWVYAFGGRMGKQPGSVNVKYHHGLYATANDNQITTVMVSSEEGTAAAIMQHGSAGSNQTVKAYNPVMIHSRYSYALVTRIAAGYAAHGMDHSGHRLWSRSGAGSSFPSPFGTAGGSPQGKPSFWLEFEPNVAPNTPSGLSPANGATVSATPTLGANFRDGNEALPGFAVGQADKVKKYRFEVWNSGNTGRLRDSGVLNASSAQQAARRVTWTPSTLPAGTYRARCTVWDQFDVPSRTATWVFTINAGGVTDDVDVGQNGTEEDWLGRPERVLGEVDPIITATWRHPGGLNMEAFELRVRSMSGGVVGTSGVVSQTVAPNAWFGRRLSSMSIPALIPGTRYYVDARGRDTEGLWSPWGRSAVFTVNAPPNMASGLHPTSGAFVAPPPLRATITDPNDPANTLNPYFRVRAKGDTGIGVRIDPERMFYRNGSWHAQPDDTEVPGLGEYEWTVQTRDQWEALGVATPWSAASFTIATHPALTMTSPANGATIDTGTPLVSWSVDRAMQRYDVRVYRRSDRTLVWSYDRSFGGTAGNVAIPAGILRNGVTYDFEVHIVAVDGIGSGIRHAATIQYPEPAALTSLTAETTPGPMEPDADPSQWSRIALAWSPALASEVPDSEFRGYVVRRRNLTTGEEERIDGGTLAARGDTFFVDRTPTSRVAYEYEVTYLRLRNLVDTVESAPVTVQHSVTLKHTVICTIGPEDLGAPLRYWEDRAPHPVREWEILPSFGPEPIPFQGLSDYLEITGIFKDIDDPYGTYIAQDVRRMVEAMGAPVLSAPGQPRGRVICYRDPLGRNELMILRDVRPLDHHMHNQVEMELEMVSAGARQGVSL